MRWRSSRNRGRPTRDPRAAAARGSLLLTALLAGAAPPAAAQIVRGPLVDELSGEAIAGGFVLLLDTAGTELSRALTDAQGQYLLRAPVPGAYRLRAVVVGRRSWTTDTLRLETGRTREYRIAMPSVAVQLPALLVEADRECRVRPEEGYAAGQLWEEAGKVLEAVVWSDREGMLRYRLVTYKRELDLQTLRVLEQETQSRAGVSRGSAFVTATPEILLAEGFIRPAAAGAYLYDAPDATVLLSEPFADLHCFSVRAPGRDEPPGLIGLAFEPVHDRAVPDVEGVLWLHAETAELRYLEFRYTRVPERARSSLIGGRIDFARLPQGMWIVDRWHIRMPQLVRRIGPRDTPTQPWVEIGGYREVGGWMEEVHALDGALLLRVGRSALSGVLVGPDGRRLAGAIVEVVGTSQRAQTDARGTFRFDSLPSGEHLLVYRHASLPPHRFPAPPYPVRLRGADTATVELTVPTPGDLLAAYCPELGPGAGTGMLGGLVRHPDTGAPAAGVRVHATWQEWHTTGGRLVAREMEGEAAANASGFYAMCGVPAGEVLTVWATAGEWTGPASETSLPDDRVGRHDLGDPRVAAGR